MTEEVLIAVAFLVGDREVAREIYPLDAFEDGWPLPEKLNAFALDGRIGIALPDETPEEMAPYVTPFVKVNESKLTDEDISVIPGLFMRGVLYQLDE
jgi:hypothetical protein